MRVTDRIHIPATLDGVVVARGSYTLNFDADDTLAITYEEGDERELVKLLRELADAIEQGVD